MNRLLVHVEGQTEEEFVNQVIREHLATAGFSTTSARLLGTRRERAARGGVRSWPGVKREVERHLLQDDRVLAALLVDYYGMPKAWPGRTVSETHEFSRRAGVVADALRESLEPSLRARFFPCVLMHEFEAMVFVDPSASATAWGKPALAGPLETIRRAFPTVEHINDSPQTAPSKRLIALDPQYEKPLQGLLAVFAVGLVRLRESCPALDRWLVSLETAGRQGIQETG